jgi:hypothetical protein
MQPYLTDAALSTSTALAAAASTAVTGAATDLVNSGFADNAPVMEWEIDAPALNATQLPDTTTVTYAVVMSPNADMSSPVLIYDKVLIQTGAGGVGAVATSVRFRLAFQPGGPNASLRYLAVRATTGAGTGNCSAASMTLLPRF